MADVDHWVHWHGAYEDPSSSLSLRLQAVQRRLADALTSAPEGPISLISACAGQGRDVIGVLATHLRRADTRALLVELDPTLVTQARAAARDAGLTNLVVREGDASLTVQYREFVPAQVALFCGIFGNVADVDVAATVAALPGLVGADGTVIWTRHQLPPDLTPSIRAWVTDAGFTEVAFDTAPGRSFAVGTARLTGAPAPYDAAVRMFTFEGDGSGASV